MDSGLQQPTVDRHLVVAGDAGDCEEDVLLGQQVVYVGKEAFDLGLPPQVVECLLILAPDVDGFYFRQNLQGV